MWAHMPATSMEAAGANVHSLQLLPLPQNTLCLLKKMHFCSFLFLESLPHSLCVSKFCRSSQGLENH